MDEPQAGGGDQPSAGAFCFSLSVDTVRVTRKTKENSCQRPQGCREGGENQNAQHTGLTERSRDQIKNTWRRCRPYVAVDTG